MQLNSFYLSQHCQRLVHIPALWPAVLDFVKNNCCQQQCQKLVALPCYVSTLYWLILSYFAQEEFYFRLLLGPTGIVNKLELSLMNPVIRSSLHFYCKQSFSKFLTFNLAADVELYATWIFTYCVGRVVQATVKLYPKYRLMTAL